MSFIQVIEFRTSKIDEMRQVGEAWEEAAGSESEARRRIMCEDRDDPGHYFNIVFFDSHESAMRNSEHPVTQEYSQKLMALAEGPPTFHNLDVVEDVT